MNIAAYIILLPKEIPKPINDVVLNDVQMIENLEGTQGRISNQTFSYMQDDEMQNITMLITNIISYKVFCSFIYLSANRIIQLSKTHSAKRVFKLTAFYMKSCMDAIPMNVKIGEKYYQKFCLRLTQGNINLLYLNGAIHCRKQCNSHQKKITKTIF